MEKKRFNIAEIIIANILPFKILIPFVFISLYI